MLQSLSPDIISPSQLHRRSQLYSQLDAPQSGLDDLSALLRKDPGNPVYLKDAAELALVLKDWDRAASLLQRLDWASADSDVKTWANANRSIALEAAAEDARQQHRHLDAADRLATLANEHPDDPRFLRARAHALRAAGNVREAEAAFRQLLASGAADVAAREAYAWLLNVQHRYAEAWNVIEPLPRPASDIELLELQANTAIWAGQTAESVQLIRALLNRRPQDAELWKRLAEAWDMLKDDRQAADALAVYVRLQSQDWRARERLAQILAKEGSFAEAAAEYHRLLEADPRNAEFLRSLGLIQETSGDLDAALISYVHAVDTSPTAAPELLLRVARLQRWTKHPDAAVGWYGRYLAVADPSLRRTAEAELALSLLESGSPEAAAARLRSLDSLDAGELVTAARASTAMRQPAAAAQYLELLRSRRPLTAAEESWLAGQYRAAGDAARALALYEQLAANSPNLSREILEALGDLRYDRGDFLGALRAFQQIADTDAIALKIARTAARAGNLSLASDTYERYARSRPNDMTAQLEAARYNASTNRPKLAIEHYRVYIAAQGATDLRLELARVYLAAEDYAAAEPWARQALAAGEDLAAAQLTLAQSLHLQGRHGAARDVLGDLVRGTLVTSAAHEWKGYVAVALDRHLEAFRSFERALAMGAAEPEKLSLLKGIAAFKRTDYARAADSYTAALSAGANPVIVEAARRDLRDRTLPTIYVPGSGLGDTNDLRVAQSGGGLLLFLPSLAGDVALEGLSGTLSQRDFSSRVNSIRFSVSRMFPTPELKIDLAMALHQFDGAPNLVTWQGSGRYDLTDGHTIGVDISREALLPINGRLELRQFNRVLNLQHLGPGFYGDVFRAVVELSARDSRRAHIEPGFERFEDGNNRTFAYLHFDLPTNSSGHTWSVIRPNVFFESFRDHQPDYFSPKHHLTLGTMWHVIRRYARWEIESEINPQLLFTDGATGPGGHGLVNVGKKVGRASLAGGAFVFWDGIANHLQWRVGGRVSVPLAR